MSLALVKQASTAIVLAEEKTKLFAALSEYANALSNLTDEQVPAAFDMTDQLQDLAEEVKLRLRDRLLLFIQARGIQTTEKGSMAANAGGFVVAATPVRTGVDPKKLEALLRKKGMLPESGMDAFVAYKVNPAKVAMLHDTGKLADSDMAAITYDRTYRLRVTQAIREEES